MGAGKGKTKRVNSTLHASRKIFLTDKVIKTTVRNLAQEIFQRNPDDKEYNFILSSLTTPEERQIARNVQSTSIKIGYFFEELFNELAKANTNLKVMPREKLNKKQEVTQFKSKLKYHKVSAAADKITRTFGEYSPENKTKENLSKLINAERMRLASNPNNFAEEEHTYYSDSAFFDKINKDAYLIESKSGANLDSKNAPDELRNLLKACIALDPEEYPTVHPVAICLYDHPANSLKNAFPSDGVYAGVEWIKLIDRHADFDNFKEIVDNELSELKRSGKLFTN